MHHIGKYVLVSQVVLAISLLAAQCDGPSGSSARPVAISGTSRLYEGTDCFTSHLRDERDFRFSVESGRTENRTINLKAEAGDTAEITLVVSNEASASGSQLVVASGSMDIVDDEYFIFDLSDERATVQFNGQATVSKLQPVTLVEAEGCAGDEVRVEIEVTVSMQPPPPAVAADPDLIIKPDTPECETRCTSLGEKYEECAASLCVGGEYPLLALKVLDSSDKSPGDTVSLTGEFGARGESLSVALAEERDGRLYHRHQLAVSSWENDHIVATIHEEVNVGLYQILLVYQVNFGEAARPVFIQGSETLPINVHSP
ncbi:MAG: hypothetical protein GY833_25435 [Aestuariibacter sp.]|nr:hypothetical protein [Aestuariibacter sp.]